MAGSISTIITNPFWAINSIMVSYNLNFEQAVKHLYKEGGYKAFTRGLM